MGEVSFISLLIPRVVVAEGCLDDVVDPQVSQQQFHVRGEAGEISLDHSLIVGVKLERGGDGKVGAWQVSVRHTLCNELHIHMQLQECADEGVLDGVWQSHRGEGGGSWKAHGGPSATLTGH
eukprot:1754842-Amphidinium_carterae.1